MTPRPRARRSSLLWAAALLGATLVACGGGKGTGDGGTDGATTDGHANDGQANDGPAADGPAGDAPVEVPANAVSLFDVWELRVENQGTYENPFDFEEIELRGRFTAPSGRTVDFFGFHDGDGNGGQTGTVWRIRFMPDEVGTWTYQTTWSDGTAGTSGTFLVGDRGLPGPLRVAKDRGWFFETANGRPFDFRGYDMHHWASRAFPGKPFTAIAGDMTTAIQQRVVTPGYNAIMIDGSAGRGGESWWLGADNKVFNVAVWQAWEKVLDYCKGEKIYIFPFDGLLSQKEEYPFAEMRTVLRYWVARFAPYYNFFGFSPTWEWWYIWSADQVTQIMGYIHDNNPFGTLLTAHDRMVAQFTSWGSFTMREWPSRTIFASNQRNTLMNALAPVFQDKPMIGSEDLWEGFVSYGHPANKDELRRAAWGEMFAGVMPLYSEWTIWTPMPGEMPGEAEYLRLLDFWYAHTHYRQYVMLNSRVSRSARQVCSGTPDQEYVIYDVNDGGDNSASVTIDLGAPEAMFHVLWYDPKTGDMKPGTDVPGGSQTLTSPYGGDWVVLITRV